MKFIYLLFINYLNSGNSKSSENIQNSKNVKIIKNIERSENDFKIERQFSNCLKKTPKYLKEDQFLTNCNLLYTELGHIPLYIDVSRVLNDDLLVEKFSDKSCIERNCYLINIYVYQFLKEKVFFNENEKFLLLYCSFLGANKAEDGKYKNLYEIYSYIIESKDELPEDHKNKEKIKNLRSFLLKNTLKNDRKIIKKQSKNDFFCNKNNVLMFVKKLSKEGFYKDNVQDSDFNDEYLNVLSKFIDEIVNDSLFISDYLILNVSYAFMVFAFKNFNLNTFSSYALDNHRFNRDFKLRRAFLGESKSKVFNRLVNECINEHCCNQVNAEECIDYQLMYGRYVSPCPSDSASNSNSSVSSNFNNSHDSFDSHLTGYEEDL